MGMRTEKPHSMAEYISQLVISELPPGTRYRAGDTNPANGPAVFECGCKTGDEVDGPAETLYYLNTCGNAHYTLFS